MVVDCLKNEQSAMNPNNDYNKIIKTSKGGIHENETIIE